MEKEHKFKVRWTAETQMDLQNCEETSFEKQVKGEFDSAIIETFGSWDEFLLFINESFLEKTVIRYNNFCSEN